MTDLDQLAKADESIDRLIESRAAAQECEEMWGESVRKHNFRRAREQRQAWCEYHRHMAGVRVSRARAPRHFRQVDRPRCRRDKRGSRC